MHKKALIAAAVTAALAVSANASAEVTLYGKIHTSIASISQDDGTSNSATAISSHASRLGVKASTDLENGMKLMAKLEYELDAVSGSYSKDYTASNVVTTAGTTTISSSDNYIFKARNVYVGLEGGFGTVLVGRHDTPHKMATAKLDPFGDTYADYNNIITVDNRLGNVVAYTNKFGAVGVAAAYYAGDDSVTGENNGAATSIMVNYDQGPLYVAAAVESYGDTVANDLQTATVFGIGYELGALKLGLAYETLAFDGSAIDDQSETYVSAQYKIDDKNTLKAAYGMRDDGVSATDDEVMSALGIDHKLDKSASVYALYAAGSDGGLANKGKLKGDASAFALGLQYKF